jgi:methylglutaconyl-CoA hydratase
MQYLKVESNEDFRIVTLNRADSRNAFHPPMIAELTAVFREVNQSDKVRAVLIKGDGQVFCAGADLNWMQEMVKYTHEQNVADSERLWDMFEAIRTCSAPVIVKAQGAVYGGGLGILASADYIYAAESTKFCFSEVKLGLVPAVISSFILRKCPDALVRPLMLSGEVFDAPTAEVMGLVHHRFFSNVPDEDIFETFGSSGLEALRATKNLLNRSPSVPWSEQRKFTSEIIAARRTSPEGQARLIEFLKKN